MAQNGLQASSNNQPKEAASSPYMSKDPNSNVNNFKIIESTLRGKYPSVNVINCYIICIYIEFVSIEGEQFANAFFSTEKKIGKCLGRVF